MLSASIDINAMRRQAGDATGFLRALANEDRLILLCQLTQGEKCVSELETQTGITQPTLSQQLGVLRHDGLVKTRRDGKFVYYQIGDERVLNMLTALNGLFCKTRVASRSKTRETKAA